MPKVSVIVPAYNVEPYVRKAMTSLQCQTLKDMEFICINDGSKDGTLAILQEFAASDPRFIIVDKENGGYGVAMNIGMSKATGEYVGILEPDDHVPVEMFGDLYEIAAANDLDFVKADFFRFAEDPESGNVFYAYNHLDKSGEWYNQVVDPSVTPQLTRFIMNTWSGIYKRRFLEEYGIRHHETPGASFQDNGFFWQTFMHARRAMFVDRPYYMNRRDNPNSSVKDKGKVYAMNVEYAYIRDIFLRPENARKWEIFKGYFVLKEYNNYRFTLGRIDRSMRAQYVKDISKRMQQAREMDELDETLFTDFQMAELNTLIRDPDQYTQKYAMVKNSDWKTPEELANERLERVLRSAPYRAGRVITAPGRLVKKIYYKAKR